MEPKVSLKVGPKAKTASEELIAAADKKITVKDAQGRVIELAKPRVLAQYRLIEAVGESSKNEMYMGMVIPLLFVRSIDGSEIPGLTTKMEVEALVQRLDDEGVSAVIAGVQEHFSSLNPDQERAAIKK